MKLLICETMADKESEPIIVQSSASYKYPVDPMSIIINGKHIK